MSRSYRCSGYVSHVLRWHLIFVCSSSRTECSRPFISGQVAHTMASEVISLLHGLLSSSASDTSKIWASAVRDVLCETLDNVPYLIETLEREGRISPRGDQTFKQETEHDEDEHLSNEHEWFFKARNVVASLCALGGFHKNVHSGCTVQVPQIVLLFIFIICIARVSLGGLNIYCSSSNRLLVSIFATTNDNICKNVISPPTLSRSVSYLNWISNRKSSVPAHIQALSSGLRKRGTVECFKPTLKYPDIRWNTFFILWCDFSSDQLFNSQQLPAPYKRLIDGIMQN